MRLNKVQCLFLGVHQFKLFPTDSADHWRSGKGTAIKSEQFSFFFPVESANSDPIQIPKIGTDSDPKIKIGCEVEKKPISEGFEPMRNKYRT